MKRAALLILALTAALPAAAQYPSQQGVSFQIGVVPRHRHSSSKDGGGDLNFQSILRSGSTSYGPVAGTTNTHTNLGTLSVAGDDLAGQDRRYATVGGGLTNYARGEYSTVAGGFLNKIVTGTATAGTIGGGYTNQAGFQATVGGGRSNVASGDNSTIPGGLLNTAEGANAFAAGTQARAVAKGSHVETDSQLVDLRADTTDQYRARFQGGYDITAPNVTASGDLTIGNANNSNTNLTMGGVPTTNASSFVKLCNSSTQRNWQISTNNNASGDLEFGRSSALGGCAFTTPAMTVNNAGLIGIGTSAPVALLSMSGTSLAQPMFVLQELGAASNPSIAIANDTQQWNIQTVGARSGRLELFNGTAGGAAANSYLSIMPSGKVGIGSVSSGNPLATLTLTGDASTSGAATFLSSVTVAGATGYVTSHSSVTAGLLTQDNQKSCSTGLTTDASGNINGCVASDRKLKAAVRSLEYNPGIIDALRPISYRWRDKGPRDDREHIGFIAQEVLDVAPAAVVSAGTDTKGIDANAMTSLLVLEIQALRKRISKLEAAAAKPKAKPR